METNGKAATPMISISPYVFPGIYGTMANPGCDLDLPSERVAKRICEITYELHRKG